MRTPARTPSLGWRERSDLRERTSRRLLVAVDELLGQGQSWTTISVGQLVKRAGIARSTFYNQFEDKGDLLRMLAADVMGDITTDARSWWELPPTATRDEVGTALGRMLDTYLAHRGLMGAVVDSSVHDERVRARYTSIVKAGINGLTDYITDGIAAGEFDSAIRPRRTAEWLVWMIERGFYEIDFTDDGAKRARVITALAATVWKSLH